MERVKNECAHKGRLSIHCRNGCKILEDANHCDPKTCKWFQTEEDIQASYEKARQNRISTHGVDDYMENFTLEALKQKSILKG